jgi:hypothetical protein
VDYVKHRQRTKVSRHRRPYLLRRDLRVLVVDLDRLATSTGSRSVRHQLGMAAFLQRHEPKHGLLDGFADCQQAVVLEESGLFGTKGFGNVYAFVASEHNALELRVESVIL